MSKHFGSTIRLTATTVTDLAGTLVTSPDADGVFETDVTGGSIIEDTAGDFHYDYTIPASGPAGDYWHKWSFTKSSRVIKKIDTFQVIPY